jgi:DNA helicase-2/ATP-dependent DNA helicase PcrA
MSALEPFEGAPAEIVAALGDRTPTGQQWEAIAHPLAPRAIVAGAGSGKTAVIAARVVWLVMEELARRPGAMPSEILCLTFTNKAAEELARRVRRATSLLGLAEGEEVTVSTYHAFGQRILTDYGARIGLEPSGRLLSEAHRWQIVASLLAERTFEHLEVRTLPTVMRNCLALNDQCADHLVTPDEVIESTREVPTARKAGHRAMIMENALQRRELAELVADYRARKREIGAFDYGDLIALANDLVAQRPDVAGDFRERYSVVLLDEYQDTNIAQARLLQALCGEGYSVFAVGDPDQNIYAWRGASLSNLLRFGDDFGARAASLPLYVNFRSGSRILQVADRVVGEVPEERRAAGKKLYPHASRGEGRVLAFVETDERAEAQRIATLIREHAETNRLANGEPAWSDVAILCRKKRLFGPIADVLREAGVPVEVVDLGGLLKLPEVVEIVAWLRLIEDPGRNIELARILQGPRWRIGYRDLVALARWSARHNRALREGLPGEDESPGDVAFALLESLDHLDQLHELDDEEIALSDEARERLREFASLLAELRARSSGALPDLVADVVERTGLHRELSASAAPVSASKLRNVANFVEFVTSFAPVDGEATLATLNAYLDATEETEDEMEPAQPSEANTVKMLTVHKAKGLEWPVVFVPGLAEHSRWGNASLFPDVSRQANPLTQERTLSFELRGDHDVLPRFDGDLDAFKEALKQRGLEEERRLCYVALTRAQQLLVVSAAHWYTGTLEPHAPGTFYREIASHDACEVLVERDCPDENPLIARRRERAPAWPLPARADDADELFPDGWHAAARRAVEDPGSVDAMVESLDDDERKEFDEQLALHLERLDVVEARTQSDAEPALPAQFGATALIDYLRCPKFFYWSVVRPLPRRPSSAARIGTEIHRWIEVQSRGQGSLLDMDELPDLTTDERAGPGTPISRLRESFKASRFANAIPLHTERKFLLVLDGFVVGGRIDAIFGEPGGPWEIVDYKTGRVPDAGDELAGVQLDVYALAANQIWGKTGDDLTLTYFYLDAGVEVSRPAGDLARAREHVERALRGIAKREFEPEPGDYCRWCDFLEFCEPGRRRVGKAPAPGRASAPGRMDRRPPA